MTYKAHVESGHIVLDEPVALEEGLRLEIRVVEHPLHQVDQTPDRPRLSVRERLAPFIGMADDLPPDAAAQHDHYLYGTPKK